MTDVQGTKKGDAFASPLQAFRLNVREHMGGTAAQADGINFGAGKLQMIRRSEDVGRCALATKLFAAGAEVLQGGVVEAHESAIDVTGNLLFAGFNNAVHCITEKRLGHGTCPLFHCVTRYG